MRFKSWINRFTQGLGERETMGVPLSSPSLANANAFLKQAPLASLLPYESYDVESGLYHNQHSVGFLLEAMPLTGASEETVTLLNNLLADSLPKDTTLQFLLWASPKIGEPLSRWEALRAPQSDILKTLAKGRVEYLKGGAFHSLIPNDTYVIRDFRLVISVVLPAEEGHHVAERLIPLRDEMMNTLQSIHLRTQKVLPEDFISLLRDLVNPSDEIHRDRSSWNEQDSLALQLFLPGSSMQVSTEALFFNEGEWEARCFHVRDYPKVWAQGGMGDLIGDLYRDALRIPCPFFISLTVHMPDREKMNRHAAIKHIRSDQQARSPLARWMPVAANIHQDWKHVTNRLEEGDRLLECCYQVVLYPRRGQGQRCETLLKNLYSAKGWKLVKPRYWQLSSWLSGLPMLIGDGLLDDLRRLGRLKTLLSPNAANVAPLQAEWKGMAVPRLLLTGRRGQWLWWDNFSNDEGNYNVAVVGKSGSGKSVFMQEIMTSLLGSGGRVWVLDVGRSFQKTCALLGGDFIEFTKEAALCINPFTFVTDFDEALSLLKPLFAMMAKPSVKTTDHENALLEQALKSIWQQHQHASTVTHIAHWLTEHPDPRASDLGTMLFPYTAEGMYGKFFEGRCTLNLQSPLVVLELEELKSKKDLQEIVLGVLMYQVTEAMYRGNREQPLACIIDEAWDLLRGESSGEFVETGCRRARKYRGAFITGTQSINDYYKTAAAQAAFENSDWLCLLSQKSESIDELKSRKRLQMSGHMERLLKSIKTVQGVYADIFIYGPAGYAVGRLMLDPFSRVLYSSKGEEYAAVKQLEAKGWTLTEAITEISKQYQ